MMISMKKTLLTIAGLLLVSGGLVFAQAVAGIPITKAPNADPALYAPGEIPFDGQVIGSGNLSVNTTGTGLLNIANGLEIRRDYNDGFSWNCGLKSGYGTNPSNKCYTNYKLLNTGTARTGYPELVSMGTVNNSSSTGGVIVLGKTTNPTIADWEQVFPALTSGVKLDISGTNLALQGDPVASFMNHSAGILYANGSQPTVANCWDPNGSLCKKYACIEDTQGNIVTCTTATAVATVSPARPACSDGIDNDGDGQTDGADPQCFCSNGNYRQLWTSESAAPNTSGGLFWAGCSNININNLGPATGTAGNAFTPTGGSGSSAVGLPSGGFTGSSSLAN